MRRALCRRVLLGLCLVTAGAGASVPQPAGWPAPVYDFQDNPVTPEGFALGRRLFYEPRLSRDGSTSCASCHQQASAFAHTRHRLSHGIGGQLGTRNAPGLANLAWQPDFMWDGAVAHLEVQPLAPLTNPVEMDQTLPAALELLRGDASYRAQFERAFGSPGIDTQRFLRAFAQFMGTMVSADAPYDRAQAGGAPLPAPAQRGLAVFRQHCAACHAEPLFTDHRHRNNGLDAVPADPGRGGITRRAEDQGRFRVPSLRNVALTAPYMHDGRFETLDAVLDHYAHGIRASATLDPALEGSLPLRVEDRAPLLAFLHALTDERFIADARFAEPAAAPGRIAPAAVLARRLLGRHGLTPPRSASVTRAGYSLPPYEVVLEYRAPDLRLYVDEHDSNTPVTGLELTVLAGAQVLRARALAPGLYAVDDLALAPGSTLSLVLRGPQVELRLAATLPEATHGGATLAAR